MKLAIDLLAKGLEGLIAAFLAAMLVMVFGNVVLRYGFNSGITMSEEVSRMLFVWLTFIGAVVAMKDHAHLGMDSLVRKLPPAGKKFCAIASIVLMLWANWLFFDGSLAQIEITSQTQAPVTGIPMSILYWPGVIASVLMSLLLLLSLWNILFKQVGDDELVLVKDSEEILLVQDSVEAVQRGTGKRE